MHDEFDDALTMLEDALDVEMTGRVKRLLAMARRIREVSATRRMTTIHLTPGIANAVAADFEELAMLIAAPPTGDKG